MRFLEIEYPRRLKERYNLEEFPEDIVEFFDQIGKKRGCLLGKGKSIMIKLPKSSLEKLVRKKWVLFHSKDLDNISDESTDIK